LNILVLEDEWMIAETLKDYLEDLGHQVLGPAMTCAAALEMLLR
jgi:DNA-binding response OmpR family regulator